jgi:ElaB/YqjD/DUF883 family membrane-anchored ribosome-binding protein
MNYFRIFQNIPPLHHKKISYQVIDGVGKNVPENQTRTKRRYIIMATCAADRMVNAGVAGADHMKIQTAEALEDAARRLRDTDVASRGEDVKDILHNVEYRVNKFKKECGDEYNRIDAGYHKRVEPVENIIVDHPIPSVLVAAGIGVLFGMLICKSRN